MSSGESTSPRLASPGTFRPQGFPPSRRLTPRLNARPCFMPVTPLGFCSPGIFPRNQVRWLVANELPSWCSSSHGKANNRFHGRRLSQTSLSTRSPGLFATFRALLRFRVRTVGGLLHPSPTADSLLSFSASPGYYPNSAATLRATCSLMRFSHQATLNPPGKPAELTAAGRGALQRLNHQAWNPTLASEISPPEVPWPSYTHESQ
jgi:hypothetical protein